ncbi:MAG: hypothetical protein COA99_01825 [Moraxellaceae bacterium]|nr:MAG: hypothetical protein COA99_01825 [Moraxellaceae bacterium]
MDKIVALFEQFREKKLSFDTLYETLRDKIQADAGFQRQVIPMLDQVQQSTPIPIADFIPLRSQIEKDVQNIVPKPSIVAVQADPDATLITSLPEENTHPNAKAANKKAQQPNNSSAVSNTPVGPSDPTLLGSSEISTDVNADDDESTMIMPSGTLSGVQTDSKPSAQPTIPTTQTAPPSIGSEDATVVTGIGIASTYEEGNATAATTANPSDPTIAASADDAPTLISSTQHNTNNDANHSAETLVHAEPYANEQEIIRPEQGSPVPLTKVNAKLIAGSVTAGVAVLIGALWLFSAEPSAGVNANVKTSVGTTAKITKDTVTTPRSWDNYPESPAPERSEQLESTGQNQPALSLAEQPIAAKQPPQSTPPPKTSTQATATTDTLNTANHLPSSTVSTSLEDKQALAVAEVDPTLKATTETTAEITPTFSSTEEEIDYLFAKITTAENAYNLTPADKEGTATYYLVKLINLAPNSDRIFEARSRIAKAHLTLAKIARENENWDDAQQQLDFAFTARSPNSYR